LLAVGLILPPPTLALRELATPEKDPKTLAGLEGALKSGMEELGQNVQQMVAELAQGNLDHQDVNLKLLAEIIHSRMLPEADPLVTDQVRNFGQLLLSFQKHQLKAPGAVPPLEDELASPPIKRFTGPFEVRLRTKRVSKMVHTEGAWEDGKGPCTLCASTVSINFPNLRAYRWRNFLIWPNPSPAPGFEAHLVFASSEHAPQRIGQGEIRDFLNLLFLAPQFKVFFSGTGAGASTPKHQHFHGIMESLPVEQWNTRLHTDLGSVRLLTNEGGPASYLVVEGGDLESVTRASSSLTRFLDHLRAEKKIVGYNLLFTRAPEVGERGVRVFVFPRNHYTTDHQVQRGLKVGISSLEMMGLMIANSPETFEQFTREDVEILIRQAGVKPEQAEEILRQFLALHAAEERVEKLTWRAWFATLGAWGRIERALAQRFNAPARELVREEIRGLVQQLVDRDVGARRVLRRFLPSVLGSAKSADGFQEDVRVIRELIARLDASRFPYYGASDVAIPPKSVWEVLTSRRFVELAQEAVQFQREGSDYSVTLHPATWEFVPNIHSQSWDDALSGLNAGTYGMTDPPFVELTPVVRPPSPGPQAGLEEAPDLSRIMPQIRAGDPGLDPDLLEWVASLGQSISPRAPVLFQELVAAYRRSVPAEELKPEAELGRPPRYFYSLGSFEASLLKALWDGEGQANRALQVYLARRIFARDATLYRRPTFTAKPLKTQIPKESIPALLEAGLIRLARVEGSSWSFNPASFVLLPAEGVRVNQIRAQLKKLSVSAGTEEQGEKLTWRAWWATLGSWGPTTRALAGFDPQTQRVLRGEINRLINEEATDGFNPRLTLVATVPGLLGTLAPERVPALFKLGRRLQSKQFFPWELLHSALPALSKADTFGEFQSGLLAIEGLADKLKESPTLNWRRNWGKLTPQELARLAEEAVQLHRQGLDYIVEFIPERGHTEKRIVRKWVEEEVWIENPRMHSSDSTFGGWGDEQGRPEKRMVERDVEEDFYVVDAPQIVRVVAGQAGMEESAMLPDLASRVPPAPPIGQPMRFLVDTSGGESRVLRFAQWAILLDRAGLRIRFAGVATADELARAQAALPDEAAQRMLADHVQIYDPADESGVSYDTALALAQMMVFEKEVSPQEIHRLTLREYNPVWVQQFLRELDRIGIQKLFEPALRDRIEAHLTAA
jgi:hypothetical protein